MKNYARIIDNVAVDVSSDPPSCFHPTIASDFVEVPISVCQGWLYDTNLGTWSAPEPTPEPTLELYPTTLTPVEFKLLFTSPERVAIKEASKTDPIIEDFLEIMNDLRLKEVILTLQSNIDAIHYLVSKNLLTEERGEEILAGKVI